MKEHRRPREPSGSEDDGGDHGQGAHLNRAIQELLGSVHRQLPKLDKADGSAIRLVYHLDQNHEIDPALRQAGPEELEEACRVARSRLNRLLQLDLGHRLDMAEGELAEALRLALEIVHGNVLIEARGIEDGTDPD